jgi:hypothetical protein
MADDIRMTTASTGAGLLTPASRAVGGLTLAVAGLLGQNAVTSALQILLLDNGGTQGPVRYGLIVGLGAGIPALLALALVWAPARSRDDVWTSHVSRAAVIVASVVVLGALLAFVGALLRS